MKHIPNGCCIEPMAVQFNEPTSREAGNKSASKLLLLLLSPAAVVRKVQSLDSHNAKCTKMINQESRVKQSWERSRIYICTAR